jgi:hypothetical protein
LLLHPLFDKAGGHGDRGIGEGVRRWERGVPSGMQRSATLEHAVNDRGKGYLDLDHENRLARRRSRLLEAESVVLAHRRDLRSETCANVHNSRG